MGQRGVKDIIIKTSPGSNDKMSLALMISVELEQTGDMGRLKVELIER